MSPSPHSSLEAIVGGLIRQPDLRCQPMTALHLVMAMRLCALCERAERDPLAELSTRIGSVTAASQIVALLSLVRRSWPEPFVVGRPCCMAMTPDEATLANLARRAMSADRAGFGAQIEGLVRSSRHEALFDQSVRCVAELAALGSFAASARMS